MLKEKEPEKKEHYHITYLRMIEKEQKEKDRKKRHAEKRLMAFEQAENDLKRGRTLSNMPTVKRMGSADGLVADLNINVTRNANGTLMNH